MIAPTLSLSDATIGVVTALPIEFAATATILRCFQELETDGRIYKLGQVLRFDERGYHVVAVTCLPTTGNNIAATRTANLKHDCPRVTEVIMCGIAGAVPFPAKPSSHVRLGDIVITNADGVVQYDFGRFLDSRFEAEPRWFRPSRRFLESARSLEAGSSLGERPWNRHLEEAISNLTSKPNCESRWERPTDADDELREFDGARFLDYLILGALRLHFPQALSRFRPLPHPRDPDRIHGKPRVFSGVIASANALQKSPSRRNCLRDRYRAKAVEMEGSGLAEAASSVDMSFFVVRGTVDYCNADKSDKWHHYAALAAGAYTLALLQATSAGSLLLESADPSATSALSQADEPVTRSLDPPPSTSLALTSTVLAEKVSQAASLLEAAIEDDGRRQIDLVDRAFETWDMEFAISQGDELALWVQKHERRVSTAFLAAAYKTLTRVSVLKVQRAVGSERDEFLRLAQRYLMRAKEYSDT